MRLQKIAGAVLRVRRKGECHTHIIVAVGFRINLRQYALKYFSDRALGRLFPNEIS